MWNPCERVSHFPLEAVNHDVPFPWQVGDATPFYRAQIAEELLLLKNKQKTTKTHPGSGWGRAEMSHGPQQGPSCHSSLMGQMQEIKNLRGK